jgi:hypothetical protein
LMYEAWEDQSMYVYAKSRAMRGEIRFYQLTMVITI